MTVTGLDPVRTGHAMRSLVHWPDKAKAGLLGILTDIDDTLSTDGAVPALVVQALADLRAAGLHVIPITGRPVGWSEPFAQTWPVDAIVAENGAVALRRNGSGGLDRLYQQDEATRARNFDRMQQVLKQIEATAPGARRATDSPGRETDIAIVRTLFGRALERETDRWVYVGDSTNDQVMFEHFEHSVGVANIARFAAQLVHLPRYVTQGERGAGFVELAQAILSARRR